MRNVAPMKKRQGLHNNNHEILKDLKVDMNKFPNEDCETKTVKRNSKSNSLDKSRIWQQQQNRITEENPKWYKAGKEKFRKSNKKTSVISNFSTKDMGERLRYWRHGGINGCLIQNDVNYKKFQTKKSENLWQY